LGIFNTPQGEGLTFYSEAFSFPKTQILVEGGFVYDYIDYKLIDYDLTKDLPWEIEMLDPRTGLDGEIVIAMNTPRINISIESSSSQTIRLRILNSLTSSVFSLNGRESKFNKSPVAEYWEKESIETENLISSVQSSSYFFTDKGYWKDLKIEKGKKYTISGGREFVDREDTLFYVMSDLHSGYSTYIPELRKVLQENPDFLVWNGDIVNWGYPTEYMIASSIAKSLPVGLYTTIGNHDVWNDGGKMYDKYFGARYYSFVFEDTLFIFLDTSGSVIGTVQMDWLENLLKESIQKNIVVFSHMSPVNPVTGLFDDSNQIDKELKNTMYSKAESEYLMKLMKEYKVTAFIAGHSHIMGEHLIDGTRYISSGALGGTVDEGNEVGYLKCSMNKENLACENIVIESKNDIAEKKIANYLYGAKIFTVPFLVNNSLRISATFIWIVLLDIFLFTVIRKSWKR
jgi:predicted phosphodiesterase